MRLVIFGKDLWDYYWDREKNIVQLLSSAVTIPQVIARHISAPVTFSFLKNKCWIQELRPPSINEYVLYDQVVVWNRNYT